MSELITVSIRMPVEIRDILEDLAEQQARSLSGQALHLIRQSLREQDLL